MRLPTYTALDWLTWSVEQTAQAAVLVTALRLPRPRPHTLLFVWILVSDVVQRAIEALYLERVAVPGVPPAGAARVLYHVVQALSTAWPALVAALAWWAFRGSQKTNGPELPEPLNPETLPGFPVSPPSERSLVPVARSGVVTPLPVKAIFALWLAFNVSLIAAHPLPRGWTQPALHTFAGLCVVLGAVAIVAGWHRRHERTAQVAGYLVVVQGVVALVGPWAGNVFASWRTVGAGMYGVAFSLLAAWQWWANQVRR